MPAKAATLDQVMEFLREVQVSARERHEDLKSDFDAKHKENQDRRHALLGKLELVENRVHAQDGRIGALETQMVSIIGDNSGGSGLLHSIDKKVDKLQEDFSSWKTEIKDTPTIRRWVYGAAAVVGFLVIAVPAVIMIVFEILKLSIKH